MMKWIGFALAIVAIGFGAGLLIDTGGEGDKSTPAPASLTPIQLGENDAVDYDPAPGDGQEGRETLPLVLDGDRTTAWESERYDTAELGNIKEGVGVYLDAGRPVVARALRVSTLAGGWGAEIYVVNTGPPDTVADWTKVASGEVDASTKTFALDTGGQRFRYYLLWITRLPEDSEGGGYRAKVSELRLLG
jgi:serine/threonine-protein kinase